MGTEITLSKKAWVASFILLTTIIITLSIFIVRMPGFQINGDLISLGITADISLGIPLLYYFTISRKLKIQAITTLVIFFLCVGITTLIIPAENQFYLNKVKNLLVVTEGGLLIYLIFKTRYILKKYSKLNTIRNDFIYNLRDALRQVLGGSGVTSLLAAEISTIRYGLFWWIGKEEIQHNEVFFTNYKKSRYVTVWSAMLFVIVTETTLVHLLLWNWNKVAAIVVTILSIYGLLFFIADLSSIIKRPVVIDAGKLFLRIGMRWNAIIDICLIESIEVIRGFDKEKEKDTLDCSLMRSPNVKITFKEPVTIHGLYGIKRTTSKLVFNIDDEEALQKTTGKFFPDGYHK